MVYGGRGQPGDLAAHTRALGPAETALLGGIRAGLAGAGIDPTDAHQLAALTDRTIARWVATGAPTDPSATCRSLAVGLGDLLVSRVPGASWVLYDDATGAIPAVSTGSDAALPFGEVRGRWMRGEQGWVLDWLTESAERLAAPGAPPVARTPADLPLPPSPQAQELALATLAHALDSVVPDGGPLIPFALIEAGGRRRLHRFVDEIVEAQRHARARVAGSGADRAAVAWDGYLTHDGLRTDAVFVEAGDRGAPSLVVAHRYRDGAGNTAAVGGPVVVEQGRPLL